MKLLKKQLLAQLLLVILKKQKLFDPLKTLDEGYKLSCLHRCQDSLDTFLTLPFEHYNTSWVLSQIGKAHFKLVDYLETDRVKVFLFECLLSPYSLEGMDVYSTVLYHLKEDMKISYLAHQLISTDRLAPQSWQGWNEGRWRERSPPWKFEIRIRFRNFLCLPWETATACRKTRNCSEKIPTSCATEYKDLRMLL